MLDTRPLLLETDFPPLRRERITTLQVNLGYRCNLSCVHCHVNAGPTRTEEMSGDTVDELIRLGRSHEIRLNLAGVDPTFKALLRGFLDGE